jgi:hypothetical protein
MVFLTIYQFDMYLNSNRLTSTAVQNETASARLAGIGCRGWCGQMTPEMDQGARPTHADGPRSTSIGSMRMTMEIIRPGMKVIFLPAMIG